jgi:hypothetical protein
LWTTAPDLARFGLGIMQAYQGGDSAIISRDMAHQIMEPIYEDVPMQAPYDVDIGLGFDLLHLGGDTWLIHFGGSFPGYISVLLLQPERGFGAAILTNSFTGYELIWEIIYSLYFAYGIFPTTDQVLEMGYSALLFLAVFLTWPGSLVIRRKTPRHPSLSPNKISWPSRLFLLLMAAGVFLITFRFRGPMGGYQTQPLWKGAPVLTKGLLGTFFTGILLLLIHTLVLWVTGRGTIRERLLFSLLVLAALAGAVMLSDLWGVMFWG